MAMLRAPTNLIALPKEIPALPKEIPNLKSNLFPLLPHSHQLSISSSQIPSNALSFSHNTSKTKRLGFRHTARCSADGYYYRNNNGEDDHHNHFGQQREEQAVYPRPSEIPWNKELCNSVHLLGNVGTPVQIKHLNSGKVLAWTRLGVRKSATDTTWINLTFWNELAHVAFQHVEKGNRIYVSGRLVSDTVEGDGEKPQTYYKVVVQQLNFVENNFSQVPSYEHEANSVVAGGQAGNYTGKSTSSTQELWQAFFANPVDWWDNRKNKRNAKYPDFKHKHTGESLWVEGKYNPPWVKSQLAVLDSRMESLHANETKSTVSYMSSDDLALL